MRMRGRRWQAPVRISGLRSCISRAAHLLGQRRGVALMRRREILRLCFRFPLGVCHDFAIADGGLETTKGKTARKVPSACVQPAVTADGGCDVGAGVATAV